MVARFVLATSTVPALALALPTHPATCAEPRAAAQSGALQGILWHQGEVKDAQYSEELKTLIADLRSDLGDPLLPFVVGQLSAAADGAKAINDQLAQQPAQVPFTGVASAEGLTGNKHVLIGTGSNILTWRE